MSRIILVCAAVSLLLLGCSPLKERQERAQRIIDRATEGVTEGIETANRLKEGIGETASKIQATALELEARVDQAQEGAEKLTGALGRMKEGTEEIKEALIITEE